ncbi:hypothetical protein ACJX0J_030766 [Zea mays]
MVVKCGFLSSWGPGECSDSESFSSREAVLEELKTLVYPMVTLVHYILINNLNACMYLLSICVTFFFFAFLINRACYIFFACIDFFLAIRVLENVNVISCALQQSLLKSGNMITVLKYWNMLEQLRTAGENRIWKFNKKTWH